MDIEEYSKYKQLYTDDVPELLLQYLDLGHWNTYVDLGCGDGSLLAALNRKNRFNGKKVYAVELSKTRMELVKKIRQDFICLTASADDVKEVANGSVDVVVSTQVIEHVQSDQAMVKEVQRMLKTGGIAYISTVFKKWYGWYFYRCNGAWVLDPTHVREYTRDAQLSDLLGAHGFTILENKKTLIWRSPLNFIIKRTRFGNHSLAALFKKIAIPVLGYYNWEIVCKKTI